MVSLARGGGRSEQRTAQEEGVARPSLCPVDHREMTRPQVNVRSTVSVCGLLLRPPQRERASHKQSTNTKAFYVYRCTGRAERHNTLWKIWMIKDSSVVQLNTRLSFQMVL